MDTYKNVRSETYDTVIRVRTVEIHFPGNKEVVLGTEVLDLSTGIVSVSEDPGRAEANVLKELTLEAKRIGRPIVRKLGVEHMFD